MWLVHQRDEVVLDGDGRFHVGYDYMVGWLCFLNICDIGGCLDSTTDIRDY